MEGGRAKIKELADSIPSELFFYGLQMARILSSVSSQGLCADTPGVSLCVQIPSSYKDTSQIGLGTALTALSKYKMQLTECQGSVSASPGCQSKAPQTDGLKQRNVFLPVLEAGGPSLRLGSS